MNNTKDTELAEARKFEQRTRDMASAILREAVKLIDASDCKPSEREGMLCGASVLLAAGIARAKGFNRRAFVEHVNLGWYLLTKERFAPPPPRDISAEVIHPVANIVACVAVEEINDSGLTTIDAKANALVEALCLAVCKCTRDLSMSVDVVIGTIRKHWETCNE